MSRPIREIDFGKKIIARFECLPCKQIFRKEGDFDLSERQPCPQCGVPMNFGSVVLVGKK